MAASYQLGGLLLAVGFALAGGGPRADASPFIPGAPQQTPIALIGATIHPVSGPPIANGTVVFVDGKLTAIGAQVKIPANARRISVAGKHVYPSLIDSMSNLGLVEINSVRATRDFNETGRVNPNVKAHVAVNPDSELIPVTRSNGVLIALTAPSGGLISGQASVLQLDGWTYEDLTLRPSVAMVVNWPRMPVLSQVKGSAGGGSGGNPLEQLEKVFRDVRAYQEGRRHRETQGRDIRWEAMLPVLAGDLPLLIHADELAEIQAVAAFADRQKVKVVISGGYDAAECAELLIAHKIPVIVGGVYRLPQRRSDPYDAAYTLANRLHSAGVTYCISGEGRFGATNVRNLPYHAATAAAYGLPVDEALKAITLYPAQILGIADRVGSLEVGKDATLFVTDGDPLETPTHVEQAFIQGRAVDLGSKHKSLWKKYEEKYRRQQAR